MSYRTPDSGSLLCCMLVFAWIAFCSSPTIAQVIKPEEYKEEIKSPIVENEPFDLIFLDDYNDNAILKIIPLDRPPEKPYPDRGTLVFEFVTDNENLLQVPWDRIVAFKTFNELLIDEANEWLKQKDYRKAFRNLLFVHDNGGKDDPNIVESLQKCLYQDGVANYQAGNFELALSIYEDMYARSGDIRIAEINKKLSEIIFSCYDGVIKRRFDKGEYIAVRQTLAEVDNTYGQKAAPLLAEWKKQFEAKSDELISVARDLASKDDGVGAHLAARSANNIYPGRKENVQIYDEIVTQFPIVFVGTNQTSLKPNPVILQDWGARRLGRLTSRTLVEMTGLTDEGGRFEFLNGKITQMDDAGYIYKMEIQPSESPQIGVPPVTAFQVASRLDSYAREDSPNYRESWAKIVQDISIESESEIIIRLRVPFVRPEPMLKIAYKDPSEDGLWEQNGPYIIKSRDKEYTFFDLNPNYSRIPDRQHPRIVERQFATASDSVSALIKGDVDVVDRVPIADLPRLRGNRDIEVRPYSIPTVHMLIPNQRNDFVKDRNFRSGLMRGINRELIVNQMLVDNQEFISGCEPISGPFPIGTEDKDQLSYGYNLKIAPAHFNDRLGMVLISIVDEILKEKMKDQGIKNPEIERPTMTLAYPSNSYAASIGCTAIARMWRELGVKTTLRPLPDGVTVPEDMDFDFLYIEAAIDEPLVDVEQLLGENGFAKEISAPIEQSLRSLSYSGSWQGACTTLRRLHRQVSNDVTIIPLWQLNEYMAYRTNLRDVGRDLVHLYQYVDRWRIESTTLDKTKPNPKP